MAVTLGLTLLVATAPAEAAVSQTYTISTSPQVTNSKTYAVWWFNTSKNNAYVYTHWWCVSIDDAIPDRSALRVFHINSYDTSRTDIAFDDAVFGVDLGTSTCFKTSYYTFGDTGAKVNMDYLSDAQHTMKVSIRQCPTPYSSCSLAASELSSNVASATFQQQKPVPLPEWVSPGWWDSDTYVFDLYTSMSFSRIGVKPNKWCLTIDGGPVDPTKFEEVRTPTPATFADSCYTANASSESLHQIFAMFDPYVWAGGIHTVTATVTLTNGNQAEVSGTFNISSTQAPRIQELSAVQQTNEVALTLPLTWPVTKAASASVDWSMDGTQIKSQSVTPGDASAVTTIDKSLVTPGDHVFKATLTTSNGDSIVREASIRVLGQIATVTWDPIMGASLNPGATAYIGGTLSDQDGGFPATVLVRTQDYGKPWTGWRTVAVNNAHFQSSVKVAKNTKVEVSVNSNWVAQPVVSSYLIGVVPKVFSVTYSVKRTFFKKFLSGGVVTYKMKADSWYTGRCYVQLDTEFAFNFAGVWFGKEKRATYVTFKKGVASASITLKYNGTYTSTMLCSMNGYRDKFLYGKKFLMTISN